MMELYLGIDGGGSHTRARLVTGEGEAARAIGFGEAGAANTPDGLPQALRAVEESYRKAVSEAGLGEADLPRIKAGMGIAGLNRRGFLAGLKAHAFPFEWTRLASDASIAQLGAFGGGDGAIVIVGTGSIGFARVKGEVITIGGYGFPVSDEGSGAELGLRAVRRALWARDYRIQHSGLTERVLDHFHGTAG
jgi:glucosamine kinase